MEVDYSKPVTPTPWRSEVIVRERSHLHPAARQMLDLDDEQRVRALRTDRWIDYPRATQALQRLQRLWTPGSENACPACCCTVRPTSARR